jgi:hypothetical protein
MSQGWPGKVHPVNASDTDGVLPPHGLKYDRSPSAEPNPPWEAGPPDGAITMADVLAVLAQAGLACTGEP